MGELGYIGVMVDVVVDEVESNEGGELGSEQREDEHPRDRLSDRDRNDGEEAGG